MKQSYQKKLTDVKAFQNALLAWYDRYGREIPWRYKGGAKADPYRVWLSEIMCQQTTVPAVIPYFLKFTDLWPDLRALADAHQDEVMKHWAGLGYYARARNLHKCARIVANDLAGEFPQTIEGLKALPGIGDYTAAAIGAIAFNISSTVVDGNVERVVARVFAVEDPVPAAKPALKKLAAQFFDEGLERPGDLAQSFMDLGSMICTPTSPKCGLCPISPFCEGRERGIQSELPRRLPKQTKPRKVGYVYLIRDDDRVLLERRPDTAMMGGMSAFPTSAWEENLEGIDHPSFLKVHQNPAPPFIRHSFTHFDLQLYLLEATARDHAENTVWIKKENLAEQGFPTLFKKALKLWAIS